MAGKLEPDEVDEVQDHVLAARLVGAVDGAVRRDRAVEDVLRAVGDRAVLDQLRIRRIDLVPPNLRPRPARDRVLGPEGELVVVAVSVAATRPASDGRRGCRSCTLLPLCGAFGGASYWFTFSWVAVFWIFALPFSFFTLNSEIFLLGRRLGMAAIQPLLLGVDLVRGNRRERKGRAVAHQRRLALDLRRALTARSARRLVDRERLGAGEDEFPGKTLTPISAKFLLSPSFG